MAVYSMTGYATAQTGGAAATNASESPRDARPGLGIEIRSVNSRFLDLTFKLADDLRGTEPALRELLGAALKRGKVEVRAWVEGRTDAGPRAPSAPELQKLVSLQDNIRAWLPTAAPLSVAEVLQLTSRQQGNMGELPAIYKWTERLVDKGGSAMVVLMPGSNIVCLLVGHRKMSLKKFVPLLMLGIAIKLAVLWRGGKVFEEQIKDFLSYIEKYQWWVVGFLFIASSLQSVRKGRPKSN